MMTYFLITYIGGDWESDLLNFAHGKCYAVFDRMSLLSKLSWFKLNQETIIPPIVFNSMDTHVHYFRLHAILGANIIESDLKSTALM